MIRRRMCAAAGSLALMLVTVRAAPAMEIAWFEQRTPGSAAGEIRILDLDEGDFAVRTPGRALETGIRRTGEIAVVTFSERRGPAHGSGVPEVPDPSRLTVVATQGDRTVRTVFSLAMAPPAPDIPAEAPGSPEPVVEAAGAPDSAPVPATALPVAAPAGPEPAPGTAAARAVAEAPSPCPVIGIRPGSLRRNVERLLGECGAHLGGWITPGGEDGVFTDWIVERPRILAEGNRDLAGLLELLEREYGLKGVAGARLPDTVDVYKIR